jgi:hypothetical protein
MSKGLKCFLVEEVLKTARLWRLKVVEMFVEPGVLGTNEKSGVDGYKLAVTSLRLLTNEPCLNCALQSQSHCL